LVVAFRPEDKPADDDVDQVQWHNSLIPGAILLEMPSLAISATAIRLQVAQTNTLPIALPTGVWEYIQHHSLYKNDR